MSIVDQNKSKGYLLKQFWQGIKKDRGMYLKLIAAIVAGYGMTFVKRATFTFKGKRYRYFYHGYNHTWVNERTIEIPLVKELLDNTKGDVLEIGNVMNYYYPFSHDVVDKYEKGKGILNEDVVDFKIHKKYHAIVSISTMEHVGWDEKVRDATKIPRSLEHLKKHLTPKGKIFLTIPLGYNPYLDRLIAEGNSFDEAYFFKRGLFGSWKQVSYTQVKGTPYIEGVSAKVLVLLVVKK